MKLPKGRLAFLEYYKHLFDSNEAHAGFVKVLAEKKLPILRFDSQQSQALENLWNKTNLGWSTVPWWPRALWWPDGVSWGTVLPGFQDFWFYPMNISSLIPVVALEAQPGDKILDACAAPGGKTMAIWDAMHKQGELIANDLSFQRAMRMKRVFGQYRVDSIKVAIGPAEKLWKKYPNYFDKILVDAPCSSEAHVIRSTPHLARWSTNRIKKLQHRQISLVNSLLSTLKVGGSLVYATCAVTPEENEVVITTLLSANSSISLVPIALTDLIPENDYTINSKHLVDGTVRILPTTLYEPMFVAKLLKTA